jgi:hypothetical protein
MSSRQGTERVLPPEVTWEKIMKGFGMKALSLAVVALAGFGMAGAAFGQTCPTVSNKTGNSTPGGGGAWTNQTVGGGGFLDVVTGGLATTNCKLVVNIGATPLANVRAFVSDTSPAEESRYRARFYFDISALTLAAANYQTKIFNAFANTAPGAFNTDEVSIRLIGGTTSLRFNVADATQPSGVKTITAALPVSAPGHYYVEFDLNKGTGSGAVSGVTCNTCASNDPGCFRYWITAEGTGSTDGSPTGTCSLNNGGWSGVTQSNLGLFTTTANFRTNNLSKNLGIDEFDSRRQTFIGQ